MPLKVRSSKGRAFTKWADMYDQHPVSDRGSGKFVIVSPPPAPSGKPVIRTYLDRFLTRKDSRPGEGGRIFYQ